MAKTTSAKLREISKPHIPPKERVQFKQLVALNPNYFGNLLDSPMKVVKKMVGNTTYEQVSCLGFNPHLNLLEATVQIKLPGGYNGLLCSPGSTEYVRFYIDYGSGWEDAGLAAFNSHDIPNTLDCANKKDKPLSYVVTTVLEPKKELCTKPVLPRVRAIYPGRSYRLPDSPTGRRSGAMSLTIIFRSSRDSFLSRISST